ncbi:MAG: hypothetical protein QXL94_04420, partial [Candidatus Parvarchaeum sp.]
AKQWNLFITRLAKELGIPRSEFHYIWVLEAQGNGYPHIHALFLGIDWLFWAGNKKQWIEDNPHSKNLKHFWQWGSVFVNASRSGNIKDPIAYMMKYIRKTFNPHNDDDKKILTQSLLWLFRKRSWNTSRGILAYLNYKPAPREFKIELVELDRFEALTGQTSPLVWIEDLKTNSVEATVFTTDDEDLNYLSERVAYFEASVDERRALTALMRYKERGLDFIYVMPSLKPKTHK